MTDYHKITNKTTAEKSEGSTTHDQQSIRNRPLGIPGVHGALHCDSIIQDTPAVSEPRIFTELDRGDSIRLVLMRKDTNMPTIKTMTLEELNRCLHEDYGMKTSKERLADGIEQGVYPFAVCIRSGENKRLFEIYERKFREWAEGVAT